MNLKHLKTIGMSAMMTIMTCQLPAQGPYLSINGGYALNMSAHNLVYFDFYKTTSGSEFIRYEQLFVSFGKGASAGISGGYMFNKNLGAELGISWLNGAEFCAKSIYAHATTEKKMSSDMLRVNPAFVVAAGLGKTDAYAKIGLLIGSGRIYYEYASWSDSITDITKMELSGGAAFGLSSALGVTYMLKDKLVLFGELSMINMSYSPLKGKLTQAVMNGTDILPTLSIRDKEIDFVDSFDYDQDNPPDENEAREELKQKLPYGSVGLNIGLRLSL